VPKERPSSSSLKSLILQEQNNAPMLSIFASIFGLLLVFLLLVNLLSEATIRERLERSAGEGVHHLNWSDGGKGFVVISFPESLRIIETGEGLAYGSICKPGSDFISYAEQVYQQRKDQLIFVILEGSVPVMAEARNCLAELMPNRSVNISWIMADQELLKSVLLGDIPSYIQEQIQKP
jgi:hypothetical protein